MRQAVIEMKMEFIPLSLEREPVWRAGLLLLLKIIKSEKCDVASVEPLSVFIEQVYEL